MHMQGSASLTCGRGRPAFSPHPERLQVLRDSDTAAALVLDTMSMLCCASKSATTHNWPAPVHAAVQEPPRAPRTHGISIDHGSASVTSLGCPSTSSVAALAEPSQAKPSRPAPACSTLARD